MQIRSAYLQILMTNLFLGGLFFSHSVLAQNGSGLSLNLSSKDTNQLKVHVIVFNPSGAKGVVSLTDQYLNTVYRENFTGEKYARVFSIDKLDDGEYTFEVQSGREIERKRVLIDTRIEEKRKLSIPVTKAMRGF